MWRLGFRLQVPPHGRFFGLEPTQAAALRQKLGRPGGKPPGPDAADNSDRETGQHRACPLKAILDALKVNAGLGEKAWGPAIVGWPFAV